MIAMPTGPLLPHVALVVPLLLGLAAALPAVRRHAIRLLPLAPLPALALALGGPTPEPSGAPDLLLGVALGLDARGALLLGATAFLWTMAGLYACAYMHGTRKPAVFAGFWCLTLAGNLGVFLAADVATFYVAFAAVSLAAYILVVHDGSERALRAGRIYLVLAVIGETSLLAGFLVAAAAADSLTIGDIRAALAAAPWGGTAVLLLVIGFGLKAGLVPLHVWLPLAHPAAPTPASAVLSGAIVKAGIFGLVQFLPAGPGAGAGTLGEALVLAGLATAYYGVLVGLTQPNPKAVLAYSTVSQMGLVIAVIGAGLAAADPGGALSAAALYAAHHGLAKGALFLAVGVVAATGRRHLWPVLGAAAAVALSVAGLPLTGGALAKAAIKAPMTGWAEAAVTLSAAGTALLLGRFLVIVRRGAAAEAAARPGAVLVVPWLAAAAAALVLPWVLLPAFAGLGRGYAVAPDVLWPATWPLVLAAAIAAAAWRLRPPAVPEGDLVALAAPAARAAARLRLPSVPRVPAFPVLARSLLRLPGPRLEAALSRWSVAGLLLAAMALAVAAGIGG